MGDEHERAAVAEQEVFEPADRLDVEVVRRLVEQQDVGLVDDRPGQQDAPLHPRGQVGELRVGVEPDPRDDGLDAVVVARRGVVVVGQPLGHLVGDGAAVAFGHVLRQPRDPQPLLADDLPSSGSSSPVISLSRVLFPSPLRPSRQSRSPALDQQIDPVEQLRAAERQADVAKAQ